MANGWTRTRRWAALGTVVVALASGSEGHGIAGSLQEGALSAFSANTWTGATWRDSTPAQRHGYVLGVVDGLRLAAVFDRAQVDRASVMSCVQRRGVNRLSRLLQEYLDTVSIGADELTMPFHVWDALVATCVDRAAGAAEVPRDRGATVWVFVSLPSPTTTSAPYLTQAACEAARELLERSATTGCYREPFRTATSTSATFHLARRGSR